MKNWLKENWFKVSLIALGAVLIFFIQNYLRDKNEIEARTNRADCLAKAEQFIGLGRLPKTGPCTDIVNSL